MEVQKDFKELLELFNAREVDYVIIGAYALASLYRRSGHPGKTG